MSDEPLETADDILRVYVADMRRHAEANRFNAGDHDRVALENAVQATELRARAEATDEAADTIEAFLLAKEPVG
jgi:hypothetical protein